MQLNFHVLPGFSLSLQVSFCILRNYHVYRIHILDAKTNQLLDTGGPVGRVARGGREQVDVDSERRVGVVGVDGYSVSSNRSF